MRIKSLTGALAALSVIIVLTGCGTSSTQGTKTFVTDDTTGQTSSTATVNPADEELTPDHPEKRAKAKKKAVPGFNGDGTYEVGADIKPGKYISGGELCYWARLKGLSGEFGDIIANGNGPGRQIVIIRKSDKAFETQRCNRWVKK